MPRITLRLPEAGLCMVFCRNYGEMLSVFFTCVFCGLFLVLCRFLAKFSSSKGRFLRKIFGSELLFLFFFLVRVFLVWICLWFSRIFSQFRPGSVLKNSLDVRFSFFLSRSSGSASSPLSPSSSPFLLLGSAWVCFFSSPPSACRTAVAAAGRSGAAIRHDMSFSFSSFLSARAGSPLPPSPFSLSLSLSSLSLSLSLSLFSLSLLHACAFTQKSPQYCWEFHDRL